MTGIQCISGYFTAFNECFNCFAFFVKDYLSMIQKFMKVLNSEGFVIALSDGVEFDL